MLLLGSTGQVGRELARVFASPNLLALDRKAADFSRPESLREVVRAAHPSILLNAGAYTAVDRAESEPDLADLINHQAVRVLAEEAERSGTLLIHYSTDYVFDGSKSGPWVETDAPAPLNVYGASKLAGERAITACCQRYLILRTSWIYSLHGSNFLRTMLRLGKERTELRVVNDQWGAPTSAAALANATRAMVDRLAPRLKDAGETGEIWAGIYHATCAGRTSWHGFAESIFDAAAKRGFSPRPYVEAIPSATYPTPARRPHNSVLANEKLFDGFGVRLPAWEDALDAVFEHDCFPAS